MFYQESLLWKKSFCNTQPQYEKWNNDLQQEYKRARNNISFLLEKIREDFPQLTVHDITHTDALWQTGSVIVGNAIDMNPMEGFILGCAFLMHDAMLSYEAVGGENALRNTVEWKDYYADYRFDEQMTEEEKTLETDFRTIRWLHAKYARYLYKQLFHRDDGSSFYIIENETLRNHLGEIIGIIAASHHWDMEEIDKLDIQCPPLAEFPSSWEYNPLKLACILRCADAAHIDSGRAPDYLLKLLKVNGVSRNHWIAQNRLSQIAIDRENPEKAIIRSNISFSENDFSAWNVAYDAICVLDREIKASNECLKKHGIQEFGIKGISGAESQEALSKYIKTDGWMPCDACIHISDVEKLVKNLGGEKLYGAKNHLEIAIRELIQNSRDAIAARRILEEGFEGRIDISIKQNDEITTVTIADNGLGMSIHNIKNCFLNFGTSFWTSDLAKEEYPGLNSSMFKSVGQFGIGFYAVFMVASRVVVESRKYDAGLDHTIMITFPSGLCLRPVLTKKRGYTTSISTMVTLTLDNKKCKWDSMTTQKSNLLHAVPFNVPYSAVMAHLTAGLDVDVTYCENDEQPHIIHKDISKTLMGSPEIKEWLKDITYARYQNRPEELCEYIDTNYERMRKIESNGHFYGIAALNTLWNRVQTSNFSIVTIGGLANCDLNTEAEFLGCIIKKPDTASRTNAVGNINMNEWAKDQYQLLCKQGLSEGDRLRLPYVLGKYDVDMTDVMLIKAFIKKDSVWCITSIHDLLDYMKKNKSRLVFPLTDLGEKNRVEVHVDYERTINMLHENDILFYFEYNTNFLNIDDESFNYNIMRCIRVVAEKGDFQLITQIESERAYSGMFGLCRAYLVEVK